MSRDNSNKVRNNGWGDKIKTNLLRNRKRRDETGASYQNSVRFRDYYYLSDNQKAIGDKLFDRLGLDVRYKRQQKRETFEILLANLINFRGRFISISMNEHSWRRSIYHPVMRVIRDYVHILKEYGYIDYKEGFSNRTDVEIAKKNNNKADIIAAQGKSRNTRIRATDKLISLFPDVQRETNVKILEPIELRDDERTRLEYKKSDEPRNIGKVRKVLKNVNRINNDAIVELDDFQISTGLIAIYIGDFKHYGRLHTRGTRHLQGLSKKERPRITINGNQTVEFDYSAFLPHMLYALSGEQCVEDPYSKIIEYYEIRRDFCKRLFLCLINGESEGVKSTKRAATNSLYKELKKYKFDYPISHEDLDPILEKLKEIHQPIKKYFSGGRKTALELMNLDAQIAIDIIDHFVTQKIPILSIHDSFIVEEKHKRMLQQVMKDTFKKHTSSRQYPEGFDIKIKENIGE